MSGRQPPVRILYLDDSASDAALVRITLEEAGDRLNSSLKHVQTSREYLDALEKEQFDVILSDYRMPAYDGDQALRAAQARCPGVPFIMITGELGEERAIETLKRGATDYVLKDRMFRLVPAILRALAESELQRKRREAEEDALKAHREANEVLESVQDPFYAVDSTWHVTFVNARAEAFLHQTRDALLGRSLWEVFPRAGDPLSSDMLRRAMRDRASVRFETGVAGNGSWLEIQIFPKLDGGLAVLCHDITERKQMEDRLKESEELTRLALGAGQTGVWSWDIRRNMIHWSDEFYEIFGLKPGSAPPSLETGFSFVHADDQDRVANLVKKVVTHGVGFDETHRVVRPDGSVRWIRGMGRPIFDQPSDQKPVRLVGLVMDMTAQKEAEDHLRYLNQDLERRNQELEAERDKWEKLIEGFADEIWTCDHEGHVSMMVDLSPNTGKGRTVLTGAEVRKLLQVLEVLRVDGSPRPLEESPLRRSLKGEVVHGEELVRIKTTGEIRIRQHSAVPVRNAEGTITQSVAIVRDVTETRKAEAEIRRLNDELEERVRQRTAALERANKELEAFSYTVSHDLKSPLRAIENFTRLLADPRRTLEPEKQAEYLGLIRASSERMAKLIESLLAFARASRHVPQKVRVDMKQLVEQVVQEQRDMLGEAATRVQVTIGELPREANGDPILLKQVFSNLLSNAFKFTRNREVPTIEIDGYEKDDQLVYSIRDNGAGFPSEKAGDLFQVFRRLHAQADFEGTGVGLANVRKIVERHGGRVWATGEEGKGATFSFALPSDSESNA